ncbi:pentapeptide repeat-containing protein [Rhodococcus rhodnii]|uniref:Pentapeptide repeat-containing protein n=1 Tax=Rhodococcus rhodnii TaxID=38312 RepID=A0A6P2CN95_9NOCA|nr:pentapeptide repeat-containing protein [Rhodococcus rhodnii]TXG92508.1 pentapeptide repeat-containing protein [Rhodococcus rhodnii]
MSSSPTSPVPESGLALRRDLLRADCSDCSGLCCVALAFDASADFPVAKPAGEPCSHLAADFRCGVHSRLRGLGYHGCIGYDCFGAGQVVTRAFAGTTWRAGAATADAVFRAFGSCTRLHEMLWYLVEADERSRDPELRAEADTLRRRVLSLRDRVLAEQVVTGQAEPPRSAAESIPAVFDAVRTLLIAVSAEIRAGYCADGTPTLDRAGADLAGRDLRRVGLVGANLRGALLVGADLRGCDLTATDLLGADLRGADLTDADLSRALFVTRTQVASALRRRTDRSQL